LSEAGTFDQTDVAGAAQDERASDVETNPNPPPIITISVRVHPQIVSHRLNTYACGGLNQKGYIAIEYMHRITLIPGDGIGPEVASNVVRIIEASGVEIQWETHFAGAQALEKFGETLPQDLLDSILRNKVALKGPITTPVGKGSLP
jgi:hypothetical protein